MKTVLEFKQVSKSFQSGSERVLALDETNLVLRTQELVGIIGPSGSGKSTLLTIAGLLQSQTSGEVFIDGENTKDFSERKRSTTRLEKIGFILQSSNLVPFLSVEKQMIFVDKMLKRKTDYDLLDSVLEDLNIINVKRSLPRMLSGGERQRAAIARVIYANPKIILADEPTASLDTERSYEVMALLKNIAVEKSCSVVVVTHDIRMTQGCDRIFEMVDGCLQEIKAKTR